MVITAIEQQKHNEKRFSVFIDGEFKFGMSDVDILFFKLKEGAEVSTQRYEYILDSVILTKAKDSAFRYLGFKPRTYKEVYDKLLSKEYGDDVIQRVMDMLTRYEYVNDYNYAVSYIKERTRTKGEGVIKLKHDLKWRGISEEIIEELLDAQSNESQIENAMKHAEKKLKSNMTPDYKEKRRVYDHLVRRGFTHDVINTVFERLFNEMDSYIE